MSHLTSCLVGEGHGKDSPRRHAMLRDQVRNAKGDHPGLAASGPGKNHERPPLMNDRLALTRVQRAQVEHRAKVAV